MSNTQRTPEEFASNYLNAPSDGFYTASIGNITHDTAKTKKIYVNVCMKTEKSGDRGAAYVRPLEGATFTRKDGTTGTWGKLPYFMVTGNVVKVEVKGGYVHKLSEIVAKPLTASVAKAIEEIEEPATEVAAPAPALEEAKEIALALSPSEPLVALNSDEEPF